MKKMQLNNVILFNMCDTRLKIYSINYATAFEVMWNCLNM